MPYSGADDANLPKYIKSKSAKTRRQWVAVWNETYERTGDEGTAFSTANGVIKGKKIITRLGMKAGDEVTLLQAEDDAMIMPSFPCESPQCSNPAVWKVVTGTGEPLYFCDDHVDGALAVLDKNGIPVQDLQPLPFAEAEIEEPPAGTVIVLQPPLDVARQLSVSGGLEPEELHVTLCYLGEVGDDVREQLEWIVRGLASQLPPVEARLNGITKFVEVDEGKDVVVVNVDAPTLPKFRETIVDTLDRLGFPDEGNHGFTPHVTVKYITDDAEMPIVNLPEEPVTFDTLHLWRGDERTEFALAGEAVKEGKFVTIDETPVMIGGPGQGGGSSGGGGGAGAGEALTKPTWASEAQIVDEYLVGRGKYAATADRWAVVDDDGSPSSWENTPQDAITAHQNTLRKREEARRAGAAYRESVEKARTGDREAFAQVVGRNDLTTASNAINTLREMGIATKPAKDMVRRMGIYGETSGGATLVNVSELYDRFTNYSKSTPITETSKAMLIAVKSQQSHLTAVANRLAKVSRGVTAEDIKAKILEPWLTTVIASPESLSLQATACRTFGHQPPGFMKEEFEAATIHWDLIYAIGELYNLTQRELTKSGDFSENDVIPIYRPYVPQESTPKGWQIGDEVRIRLNPLTSWTRDIQEATLFAEFLGSPGSPGLVLKTFIPIKSIISIPEVGFGMPGTKEVIPAGGEYTATVEGRYG
jgi:2'-5' RNA ligase